MGMVVVGAGAELATGGTVVVAGVGTGFGSVADPSVLVSGFDGGAGRSSASALVVGRVDWIELTVAAAVEVCDWGLVRAAWRPGCTKATAGPDTLELTGEPAFFPAPILSGTGVESLRGRPLLRFGEKGGPS